jgi:hypothetical protein
MAYCHHTVPNSNANFACSKTRPLQSRLKSSAQSIYAETILLARCDRAVALVQTDPTSLSQEGRKPECALFRTFFSFAAGSVRGLSRRTDLMAAMTARSDDLLKCFDFLRQDRVHHRRCQRQRPGRGHALRRSRRDGDRHRPERRRHRDTGPRKASEHSTGRFRPSRPPVCTENPIRVDDVTESPKLAE